MIQPAVWVGAYLQHGILLLLYLYRLSWQSVRHRRGRLSESPGQTATTVKSLYRLYITRSGQLLIIKPPTDNHFLSFCWFFVLCSLALIVSVVEPMILSMVKHAIFD